MTDLHKRADDERINEILDGLSRLNTSAEIIKEQFATHLKHCQENFCNIANVLEKHSKTIYGNGTPGHVVRLDRLEQVQESRTKHFMLIWGAIITTIVGTVLSRIWGALRGHG